MLSLLVTVGHFQFSLIFAGKTRNLPLEQSPVKEMVRNALAYHGMKLINYVRKEFYIIVTMLRVVILSVIMLSVAFYLLLY